ncbi:Gfo/Idh/MocA family oxidoreductase [Massilia sp. METH4]|uniref:Gfo/Idh/MocA family protein n=1 Tax=Massilia sp. METH4 TaxID=3123041 RepID=UPI0030D0B4ED
MSKDFPPDTDDAGDDIVARRRFLQRLAGVVASSTLLSALPWMAPLRAQPAGRAPSDRVRVAVIGTGSRGTLLLKHLLRTPGVEVVALCDDYPPHLQAALAVAGNKPVAFTDHRRLLDMNGLDGVLIATPLHEHAPMCLDAFAADKHVFCEKSLALTVEECKAVARAAHGSRRVFQIGHQRLFSASFLHAHEMVASGQIGNITQIRASWHRNNDWRRPVPRPELERKLNWRLYRASSAGLMAELASHHLQIANWFLDAAPLSCVGYGSINHWKDDREVHDNVNVLFRYRDGVTLLYDSLTSNRYHGLEIQIMGPKGTIEGESGKVYFEQPPPAPGIVRLIDQLEKSTVETIPIGGPTWKPDSKQATAGQALRRDLGGDDGTAISMAAFANAIRLNQKTPQMIDHAYRSAIAVLMGQAAMDQGREIAWPGDYS